MKRWLSLVLIFCLLMTSGCSQSTKKNTTSKQSNSVQLLSLKQDVVDDNIRTYYQVFVYSFCDSTGDGIGDLNGVTQKLDYIKDLGCNGIWLSPIHPATTYHKYDVTDYMNIDKEYGTLDDMKKLIAECHKRNIHVLMDLVINHTSAQHQWFVKAADYLKQLKAGEKPDSKKCPYVNYYNFKKNASEKPGYVPLKGTKYYYEARFWDQMPDLNLGNPAVRKELEKVMSYWLNLGVDGYRLDAAKEYYSGNTKKNTKTLRWINSYCKSVKPDAYLVAEVWDIENTIMENYKSGIDSFFNFPFAQANGEIVNTVRSQGDNESGKLFAKEEVNYQKKIAKNGNKNQSSANFLSNHDIGRISGFMGQKEELMKYAAAINLMLSGNAFIYYGEELGMNGSAQGSPGKDENKRAPMYWDKNAKAKGMTKGPQDMDEVTHEFAPYNTQKDQANSIYNYYRNVLRIRNAFPQISHGTEAVLDIPSDGNLIALSKTYDNSTLWVIMNNSEKSKTVDLSSLTDADKMVLKTSLGVDSSQAKWTNSKLTIPKYGIAVLGEK